MAKLSDRIKSLRLSAGMTQEEFGKKFGIVKSTVSLYESGKSTPNDEIKKQICDYFNVSLDYLHGVDKHSGLDYTKFQRGETVQRCNDENDYFFFFFDTSLRDVFKLRFKNSLEDKGMNVRDFSEMSEIDLKKCEDYLEGAREPSLEDLIQMSHALEVSTDYLLGLSPKLSYYENKVLSPFVKLNRDNKDIVIGKAKDLLREQEFGESVAAEEPMRKAVGK